MKSSHLVNGTMFLVVAIVSFLAGEWALRALPVTDRMGWNLVPSVQERVESAGPKPQQSTRIVVLGDSFLEWRDTSGDNYARIAEENLRHRDFDLDLINLGLGGTGLFDYFSNLVRYGDLLEPDLIVLNIYVGNDLVASPWPLGSEASIEAALHESSPDRSQDGVYLLKRSIV